MSLPHASQMVALIRNTYQPEIDLIVRTVLVRAANEFIKKKCRRIEVPWNGSIMVGVNEEAIHDSQKELKALGYKCEYVTSGGPPRLIIWIS